MNHNQIIEEIMAFNKPDLSKLSSLLEEMRESGIPPEKISEFEFKIKNEVMVRNMERVKLAYNTNFTLEELLTILNYCKSNPELTNKMNKLLADTSSECAKDTMDFMMKFFEGCEEYIDNPTEN